MNKIKLFLNLLIVPVYFTLVLGQGVYRAFVDACAEVADSVRQTIRIYK